jgi:prepilin-type processing-associated H-X9-DG protein
MIARGGRRYGLTILELLASVSVITLLSGLLLPAVLEARAAARRAACQSNLRQWTLAVQQYADLHAGRLPRRGQGILPTWVLNRPEDWFNALPPLMDGEPYIELVRKSQRPRAGTNSVWICPEAVEPTRSLTSPFFPYGMNMALSTWLARRPDHIDRVGPQQTMVFMADGLGPYCSLLPSAKAYSPVDRHSGAVNIAFLDGRVESIAGEEIGVGVGDPRRPDIRWFPPNSKWSGPPD